MFLPPDSLSNRPQLDVFGSHRAKNIQYEEDGNGFHEPRPVLIQQHENLITLFFFIFENH
jgi:hypothetical protein